MADRSNINLISKNLADDYISELSQIFWNYFLLSSSNPVVKSIENGYVYDLGVITTPRCPQPHAQPRARHPHPQGPRRAPRARIASLEGPTSMDVHAEIARARGIRGAVLE